MKKEIVIIAGANGVGKTTFARAFLREYDHEFLNRDYCEGQYEKII